MEKRRGQHKKLGDGRSSRDRRRQEASALGKDRREALLRTKRFKATDDLPAGSQPAGEAGDVIALIEAVRAAPTPPQQLPALQALRRALSSHDPPLEEAAGGGMVAAVTKFLQAGADPQLALEAAWCCSNLATSREEGVVREVLAVTHLMVQHVEGAPPSDAAAEQCLTALGNVAGGEGEEGQRCRKHLLAQGALGGAFRVMAQGPSRNSNAATAAWALSNMVRGAEEGAIAELMRQPQAAATLLRCLQSGDASLAGEVAWTLAFVAAGPEEHAQALLAAGLLPPTLAALSSAQDPALMVPLVRTLGNVASLPSPPQGALCADPSAPGAVAAIAKCLGGEKRLLKKDACWALSCLAGMRGNAGAWLVTNSGGAQALLAFANQAPFDLRIEACYAVANLCAGGGGGTGDPDALRQAASQGALATFLGLVESRQGEAVVLGLQFLEMFMRVVPGGAAEVEALNGFEAIENVQYTAKDEELYKMAGYLADTYLNDDDADF